MKTAVSVFDVSTIVENINNGKYEPLDKYYEPSQLIMSTFTYSKSDLMVQMCEIAEDESFIEIIGSKTFDAELSKIQEKLELLQLDLDVCVIRLVPTFKDFKSKINFSYVTNNRKSLYLYHDV